MAFKTRKIPVDGRREMTVEELKWWIMTFDEDKDGKISGEELEDAVRVTGGWFAGRKGKRGVKSADSNGNGYIEESEIKNLVEFAQKNLGVKIVNW